MPKKKKCTTSPVVVGTVSTRSTRRESIVNIQITPKSNKTSRSNFKPKQVPQPTEEYEINKNVSRTTVPSKAKSKPTGRQHKNNETVLEILKDWSDSESSQDEKSSLLEGKTFRTCEYVINAQQDSLKKGSPDKQSLIDILEGNQSISCQKNKKLVETIVGTQLLNESDNDKNLMEAESFQNDESEISTILENLDVNKTESQSEVIEECVIDNNCIIIEEPEDQVEEITIECVTDEFIPEESGEVIIGDFDDSSNIEMKNVDISEYVGNSVEIDSVSNEFKEIAEDLVYEDGTNFSVPAEAEEIVIDEHADLSTEKLILDSEENCSKQNDGIHESKTTKAIEVDVKGEVIGVSEEIGSDQNLQLLKIEGTSQGNRKDSNSKLEESIMLHAIEAADILKLSSPKGAEKESHISQGQPLPTSEIKTTKSQEPHKLTLETVVKPKLVGLGTSEKNTGKMNIEANMFKKEKIAVDEAISLNQNLEKEAFSPVDTESEICDSVKQSQHFSDNSTLKGVQEARVEGRVTRNKRKVNYSNSYTTKSKRNDSETCAKDKVLGNKDCLKVDIDNGKQNLFIKEQIQIDSERKQTSITTNIDLLERNVEDMLGTADKDVLMEKHGTEEEKLCIELEDKVQLSLKDQAEETINTRNRVDADNQKSYVKESSSSYCNEASKKDANKNETVIEEDDRIKCEPENKQILKTDRLKDTNVNMTDEKSIIENSTAKDSTQEIKELIKDMSINSKSKVCENELMDIKGHVFGGKSENDILLSDEGRLVDEDNSLKESDRSGSDDSKINTEERNIAVDKKKVEKKKLIKKTAKINQNKIFCKKEKIQTRRSTRNKYMKKEPEKCSKDVKTHLINKEEKKTKSKIVKPVKDNKGKPKKEIKSKDSKIKKIAIKGTKETPEKENVDKSPTKIDNSESLEEVRRSSRIKSISVLKKRSTGFGLVRSKSDSMLNESELSDSNSGNNDPEKTTPASSPKPATKERLTKTRCTRSSENLTTYIQATEIQLNKSECPQIEPMEVQNVKSEILLKDPEVEERLKQFVHLKENMYKTDRQTCKEAKKMTCDCFLTEEDIKNGEYGCGEDCLNRLLMIECGNLCQVSHRCTNKRFQKAQFAPVEVFKTEKKGLGLRAAANIPYGEFILEYVGEVLNPDEFEKRAENYSNVKNIHYYFMSLRADAIIDATGKGNISRFINHSCDPNAETQKWTVNGELRIGFFSTRTILAGEEITFDYRFQRYGKEAQKCYCEASTCRGWLGDQPDDEESEDDDEEEEEEIEEQVVEPILEDIAKPTQEKLKVTIEVPEEVKPEEPSTILQPDIKELKPELQELATVSVPTIEVKRKSLRKKPRKDIFEDLDQLDEEIEMLVTTGLKNQAHTLKLSRLMVRAKEPEQRKKLLRILRRGELPCRRLFLDYHGLRLMHGYMIDAQHLASSNKKFESLRLELLQTLAVLPIQNKTMLQDSKVLPTVEKWAAYKNISSPIDSDSSSPKNEQDNTMQDENKEIGNKHVKSKEDEVNDSTIVDQEEEIKFLATKLLEEWANLKEMFRIPKKERIEQMKEHEREANRKFMASSYGQEQNNSRKNDHRHRSWSKNKMERSKKGQKYDDKDRPSAAFLKISKHERRKLFALQVELREEERRLKQREMWRQHELNCLMIGTDPRFTAPFDPSRGYQYIWNPTMGQWQTYPLSLPQNQPVFSTPTSTQGTITLPNMSVPPPTTPQRTSLLGYSPQINMNPVQPQPQVINLQSLPPAPSQQIQGVVSQLGIPGIPSSLTPTIPTHSIPGIPSSLTATIPTHSAASNSVPLYQEVKKEEDASQVKFAGPIPPPVKLPPKWKCAKDKYGRPYYYHIKIRKSQWEPPPFPEEVEEESSESSSSSETSSQSSESSSENSDSDDEIDDTQLLQEVRKQMEKSSKLTMKPILPLPEHLKKEKEEVICSPDLKNDSDEDVEDTEDMEIDADEERPSSIDVRLKEQFDLLKDYKPAKKKRRFGLCQEIMISPRTEEDRLQFREDLKRYRANKEKLKRQRELILQQTKKQLRETSGLEELKKPKEKRSRTTVKSRIKEMSNWNNEAAKKIKETFRSNMATTVVSVLNAYRKPDCKEARITNTEDFKHLARKLTHFVMLKEMKHIDKIEDLTCTDNVKAKAREYIKKYMSKFGETYQKRHDEPDFKD